jgi:hypothetical protein
MKQSHESSLSKSLILGWAILFFSYVLLGVWVGTGEDALAGPSTQMDNVFTGLLFAWGASQLAVAIVLRKRPGSWLFWTAAALTVLSVAWLFGPVLFIAIS